MRCSQWSFLKNDSYSISPTPASLSSTRLHPYAHLTTNQATPDPKISLRLIMDTLPHISAFLSPVNHPPYRNDRNCYHINTSLLTVYSQVVLPTFPTGPIYALLSPTLRKPKQHWFFQNNRTITPKFLEFRDDWEFR